MLAGGLDDDFDLPLGTLSDPEGCSPLKHKADMCSNMLTDNADKWPMASGSDRAWRDLLNSSSDDSSSEGDDDFPPLTSDDDNDEPCQQVLAV